MDTVRDILKIPLEILHGGEGTMNLPFLYIAKQCLFRKVHIFNTHIKFFSPRAEHNILFITILLRL